MNFKMNAVAIIGHPSSGLEHVEDLMRRCGMQQARPSRREGMTPHDIAKALIKAYQCEPVDVVSDEDAFKPLQVGPVWHGMALDLLLGNLEQPFWGWADADTLYLLDYWHSLDPKMVFVLVYDHPRSVLQALVQKSSHGAEAVPDARAALDNWAAYNAALLNFHLRHPECSMLVSVEQVRSAVDAYLEQLGQKLLRHLELEIALERVDHDAVAALPGPLAPVGQLLNLSGNQWVDHWQTLGLENYVLNGLLEQCPQVMQLFAEIQSAASLAPVSAAHQDAGPMQAWESMLRQRSMVLQAIAHLENMREKATADLQSLQVRAQSELENFKAQYQLQLASYQHEKTELSKAKYELEKQITEVQKLVAKNSAETTELREENDLLLKQLHRVQEELERNYLASQALKQGGCKSPRPKIYGAAERVKRQLTYRLGAKVVAHSKTFTGIFQLLPALLSEVIVFRREKELRTGEKLPPISQYADAHEAERVRQHLSYRLGHVLIETARKPYKWPLLPFTLLSETKAWRHERGRA